MSICDNCIHDEVCGLEDNHEEAITFCADMIPKEQEPCDNAISRQMVLEQTYLWSKDEFLRVTNPFDYLRKRINSLPPVKQEPKTGHWIEVIDEIDSLGNKTWHHKCSICGNEDSGWGNYKYCPNCGARMIEPQESEESNETNN